jgi:ribose transport system permease protein
VRELRLPRFSGIWIGTAVLFAVGFLINPKTVSESSIYSMLPFFAILAIASIGQTLVVMQRGLDLSVPGAVAAAAVAFSKTANVQDDRVVYGIVLALVVVAIAGLISGIAVTRFHVTPLVATLAVNALLLSFTNWYSGGFPTGAPDGINQFVLTKTVGVPNLVIVAVTLALIFAFLLRATVFGRRFLAAGVNPRAARAAGVPVQRYVMGTYVVASLFYGLAGILLAAYIKTPPIYSGDAYLLGTVAAVVLGGTSLAGGVGSVIATMGGALFLSQLSAIVLGIGLPAAAQGVVQAVAIVLVVGGRNLDVLSSRLRRPTAPAPPSVPTTPDVGRPPAPEGV